MDLQKVFLTGDNLLAEMWYTCSTFARLWLILVRRWDQRWPMTRVRKLNLSLFFCLQMLRFSALCGPNEQKFGELLNWPKVMTPSKFLPNPSTESWETQHLKGKKHKPKFEFRTLSINLHFSVYRYWLTGRLVIEPVTCTAYNELLQHYALIFIPMWSRHPCKISCFKKVIKP